jgi:high affinity Mn2+ porin
MVYAGARKVEGPAWCQPEKILQTYYSYSLHAWSSLSFDYQFVVNPAYNADRGPVHIFVGRLHAEF